ncbi:restriction endonuclease [Povalibacter sp.]|uniref:restriction endonuclease n=1 Tax=Povalibacter sp. TaxID=1962978 RepID=UPI002F3E460D
MARRRESFIDVLLVLPWWVSGALAVVSYLVLTYAAPAYFSLHPLSVGIGKGLSELTPLFCGLFIVLALGSFIRARFIARKFDQQRGLEDIRALPWRRFESIVGEAFRRRGYSAIENAVDGADGGVDLVLRKDGKKYFVQCKQWRKATVGVKPIRELFGVVSAQGAAGGIFVTSGVYTADASDFAATSGVELIDGPSLQEMIEESRSAEPYLEPTITNARATTTWSAGSAGPSCPRCGSSMVGRTAKRGANAGSRFWGCPKYPDCRGTKEIE